MGGISVRNLFNNGTAHFEKSKQVLEYPKFIFTQGYIVVKIQIYI
jgi:hypothetical protein